MLKEGKDEIGPTEIVKEVKRKLAFIQGIGATFFSSLDMVKECTNPTGSRLQQ